MHTCTLSFKYTNYWSLVPHCWTCTQVLTLLYMTDAASSTLGTGSNHGAGEHTEKPEPGPGVTEKSVIRQRNLQNMGTWDTVTFPDCTMWPVAGPY